MAAIITEQFRRNSRKLLLDDINNNSYYIGIGKGSEWSEIIGSSQTSPFPLGSIGDQQRVRNNLLGLFRVNNSISAVIPKNVIDPTRAYKVFNQYDPTCFYASDTQFPCFVTSSLQNNDGGNGSHVFLCISKTISANEANISSTLLGTVDYDDFGIFTFEDGYTWTYLGVFDVLDPINSNAFVAFDYNQNQNISPITSGLFHGFHIVGGIGENLANNEYTVSVKLSGLKDGTYTDYTLNDVKVIVNNNRLTKIALTFPETVPTDLLEWNQDTKAKITTVGFEDFIIAPCIAPLLTGFEKDLENSLPSWYIGFYADTISTSYIPSGTSYRQISLIKNPKKANNTNITESYIQPLRYFTLSETNIPQSPTSTLGPGWKMIQNNNEVGAISYISEEQSEIRYYYHVDQEVGFGQLVQDVSLTFSPPSTTDSVQIVINSGPTTINNIDNPGYKRDSGEILFIDNRSAVTREEGQNEELKIIIQL